MKKRSVRIAAFFMLIAFWVFGRRYVERKIYESCAPGENCPALAYIDGPESALISVGYVLFLILFGVWAFVGNSIGENTASKR